MITDPTEQLVLGLVVVLVSVCLIAFAARIQQFALDMDDASASAWRRALHEWTRKNIYGDPIYPLTFQICGALGVCLGVFIAWVALTRL